MGAFFFFFQSPIHVSFSCHLQEVKLCLQILATSLRHQSGYAETLVAKLIVHYFLIIWTTFDKALRKELNQLCLLFLSFFFFFIIIF